MWNLERNDTNELIKQKKLTDLENEVMATSREGWGGGRVREFGINMYTLLYLKWITNKVVPLVENLPTMRETWV